MIACPNLEGLVRISYMHKVGTSTSKKEANVKVKDEKHHDTFQELTRMSETQL